MNSRKNLILKYFKGEKMVLNNKLTQKVAVISLVVSMGATGVYGIYQLNNSIEHHQLAYKNQQEAVQIFNDARGNQRFVQEKDGTYYLVQQVDYDPKNDIRIPLSNVKGEGQLLVSANIGNNGEWVGIQLAPNRYDVIGLYDKYYNVVSLKNGSLSIKLDAMADKDTKGLKIESDGAGGFIAKNQNGIINLDKDIYEWTGHGSTGNHVYVFRTKLKDGGYQYEMVTGTYNVKEQQFYNQLGQRLVIGETNILTDNSSEPKQDFKIHYTYRQKLK